MADNFKKSIFDKATSVPGMAKGAGVSALGGIGSLLGAGIGAGGSLVDTLGSLAGVSAEKLESLPVVGDIIKTLADKLGMTTSQAAAIVSGALTMLTSKMKRSGSDSMDDIDFDDRGTLSTPTLHANEDTGRSVLASDCGGVVQTESWTVAFDALEGNWTVEGTRSGMQSSRAVEDERYLSDEGDISFVVLSGTHPSSDGDSFTFATEDGVLRIDSVLAPGTIGSDALEIPAAPVVFAMDVGPSGGGWDPDPTQHYAMVPVTNSDIVLRVDLDGWTVDVLWD